MLVEATRVLYYGLKRRKVGERFELKPYRHYKRNPKTGVVEKDKDGNPIIVNVTAVEQFSPKCMVKIETENVRRTARKNVEPSAPVEPPPLDEPPSDDGLGEPTGSADVL